EILRTVFAVDESKNTAVQVIVPELRIELGHGQQAESDIEALCAQEATQPFDLSKGPLIRGRLVELVSAERAKQSEEQEGSFALLITLHHIISDGWSVAILVSEVCAYYNGLVGGSMAQLKPLPIQYADYAIWQRNYLQGEILEKQLKYWQSQFEDIPEPLSLPTDKSRPA